MFLPLNMKLLLDTLILFALLAGFSSCSPNPHAEKVKTLDSILAELVSTEKALQALSAEKAETILEEVTTISDLASSFLESFEEDTLYSEYESLKLPLTHFTQNYATYARQVKQSQKQVKTLGNDLKKGFLNEKAGEYYQTELSIAQGIIDSSRTMVLEFENVLTNFNRIHPQILALVEESAKKEALENE
jgi:hypothetical protein